MSETNKRNNGIDLLRILSMYMVCCLYILGVGGILNNVKTAAQHNVFMLIEIICLCAVNCFALISGYVSSCDTFKVKKIISFWLQVVFYSFFESCILFAFGYSPTSNISILISNLFPIINRKFWYATDYMVVMLVMPIITRLISKHSFLYKNTKLILIVIYIFLMTIFSNYTNKGYSAVWLCFVYLIGREIRISDYENKIKKKIVFIMLIISATISYLGTIVLKNSSYSYYTSLSILLFAIMLVILFGKSETKLVANKLSKYAFGVYLFQCNEMMWRIIDSSLTFITNNNIVIGALLVLLCSLLLYCAGMIVETFRQKMYKLLKTDILVSNISTKIDKFFARNN